MAEAIRMRPTPRIATITTAGNKQSNEMKTSPLIKYNPQKVGMAIKNHSLFTQLG